MATRGTATRRHSATSTNTGRRASKKQSQISEKFAVFFSLAGLSTVALTSASSLSASPATTVNQPATSDVQTTAKAQISPVHLSLLNRARAASRSEVRISKADAQALNAAATAPAQKLSTNPRPLTASDRMQLRAFVATTDQLNDIVEDTQSQIAQAATAQILAKKEAQQAAAVAARAARIAAEKKAQGGLTYPAEVGSPSGNSGAPVPSQAQLEGRVSPIVGSYRLSARYGQRGYMWSTGWHTGIDFVVPSGTQLRAATSGVIINAGWGGAYGNRIEIATADGYIITYNHLSHITQTSGTVSAGDVIGRSGSTGNTTGPHLHFEVLYNDRFVNPAVWLWGASR